MTLDEAIAIAKESSENQYLGDRGREDYKQLAAWLEELKQYKEENQPKKSDSYQRLETNLDHYKREILEDCMWNLAVVEGKPKRCDRTKCVDCDFSKDRSKGCHEKSMEWLEQPYIKLKPAYKLAKFEKDLLQSFLCTYEFKDVRPLTWMKEEGYFKGVDENATIEDILANCDITEED